VQATTTSLFESLAHQGHAHATDFNIHLQSGDSGARSGNFEVHVAVVVFCSGNIGQNGRVVAFHHEAHGDACACCANRHSRIHQRE
jgi:hypothetical protein